MDLISLINPLYALSGLLVGMLVGMTGVGGGSLMTPLLILLFGIRPETAVGTDLLYASATKSVGTAVHGLAGSVDWKVVGRLAAGSIPGTAITIYLLSLLGPWSPAINAFITTVLGIALFLTVVALVLRNKIVAIAEQRIPEMSAERTTWLTVATGFALGVLVSLSSIGAGAIGATLILLLYPRLPAQRLVGTDIAHEVPLTLVAGIGHASLGHVDWQLLASLLIGSLPGIWIGAQLTKAFPERLVRTLLCVSLVTAGLKVMA